MGFKYVVSVASLAFGTSLLALACSAQTSNSEDTAQSTDQDLTGAQVACTTDDDCIAIPQGGCCSNGWKVAVNVGKVTYYDNHHKCKTPDQVCPLYVIDDTRVAQCSAKHTCEMIAPEDIQCGGFVADPHACPKGYDCESTSKTPDVPGACKPSKSPADCRSKGCSKGDTCEMCWGSYACIPSGAKC